jgi:predicted nucleotide-binding protein (sugar kinase/HSP70/actin superfamily)
VRITTPNMGGVDLLLTDLFERLGVDYLPSPKTTNATMKLGLQHSPEFACLPLKVTVGNLIEGLEAGADATLMVGGCGPCRFGYYADIQRRIIEGLGYEYEAITLEPPSQDFRRFLATLRRISGDASYMTIWNAFKVSFRKGQAFDRIEKRALETRCYETERGAASAVREQAIKVVAAAKAPEEIIAAEARALALFDEMPRRDIEPLKIGVVGEFYLLLEPFINFDIEEWLGERGVYIERSVYLTDWIGPSTKNPVGGHTDAFVAEAASPYLDYRVGGEGQATIGHTMIYKRAGFDGIIQLLPFTCMPDTIAKSILPAVCKAQDMPALTLIVDEQTGKAGVHTRLEAFIDLLDSRRRARARAGRAVPAGAEVTAIDDNLATARA